MQKRISGTARSCKRKILVRMFTSRTGTREGGLMEEERSRNTRIIKLNIGLDYDTTTLYEEEFMTLIFPIQVFYESIKQPNKHEVHSKFPSSVPAPALLD